MQPDRPQSHEYEAAFNLLLRHLDPAERAGRVARAVELVRQGNIDPHGLFVLRDATRIVGVMMCEPVAGAAAIIWPPIVVNRSPDLEDLLIIDAVSWMRRQGARLGQCLIHPEHVRLAGPLLRHGFNRITTLAYLSHDHLTSAVTLAGNQRARLTFDPYNPDRPEEFHATLVTSYSESLDCPEVNGVRTVAEVIAGYKAQGLDTRRWWLVREEGKPVGVLITNVEAGGESWDVGYMGVVPWARRRGHGAEMLHHVFRDALAAGAVRVTLCVDERNAPACRLYQRMGFQTDDHRAVFLTIWQRGE